MKRKTDREREGGLGRSFQQGTNSGYAARNGQTKAIKQREVITIIWAGIHGYLIRYFALLEQGLCILNVETQPELFL